MGYKHNLSEESKMKWRKIVNIDKEDFDEAELVDA